MSPPISLVNAIPRPATTPVLLKSSASLELASGPLSTGLKPALQRRSSVEKTSIDIPAISDDEDGYGIASAPLESWTAAKYGQKFGELPNVDTNPWGDFEEAVVQRSSIKITQLPEEVQEQILSYIVGDLGKISSRSSGVGVKNWNRALRPSRAKDATRLALVSPLWTRLIQQRLYRHLRIAGTLTGLDQCYEWFAKHPRFKSYVRHIEFWVPIWEIRPKPTPVRPRLQTSLDDMTQDHTIPVSRNYCLSSKSSTIEEMFRLIHTIFPKAAVLTIEGGTCKKPPKILLSRNGQALPKLSNIKTLILKGAWTMIRDVDDYTNLTAALPSLKDWQCMYAAPKYKAYQAINAIVPKIVNRITHLHICMDGFYSKKWLHPNKSEDLRLHHHLCSSLGPLLLQLEALTLSGRACASLFTSAVEASQKTPGYKPQLQSIDLVLRTCCKDSQYNWLSDNASLYNTNFIHAFEKLVLAATSSLTTFRLLTSMRIRIVDLDSPMAHLNPYFNLKNGLAYGLWSEAIVFNLVNAPMRIRLAQEDEFSNVRPGARFGLHRPLGRLPSRIHVKEYLDMGIVRL